MRMDAFWEPDETDARTDKPAEGSRMLCRLAITIPTQSDDMSMTMDGNQLDMTLTLTPDQMKSVGEFLIVQAEHSNEHLQHYLNNPGTYIFDQFTLEGAKR
ncbi:hypothetical protein MCC02031_15760 [Bifidobacteriaceae bacterium MCC02031]|nr:hypothetical protein MCC02031_15760 [Bifidobacteriaceae bacterium MCC02031]